MITRRLDRRMSEEPALPRQDSPKALPFFDVRDIPAGLNFEVVLEHYVRVSAMVAIRRGPLARHEEE
jgi:hypothetical protein